MLAVVTILFHMIRSPVTTTRAIAYTLAASYATIRWLQLCSEIGPTRDVERNEQ